MPFGNFHKISPTICFLSRFIFHRLCSLTITRLSLLAPLPSDLSSLSLAVKMQSSKRTLRSHEISVGQSIFAVGGGTYTPGAGTNNTSYGSLGGGNGTALLETELDLHFSLQYPHFIKRDGNRWVASVHTGQMATHRTINIYNIFNLQSVRIAFEFTSHSLIHVYMCCIAGYSFCCRNVKNTKVVPYSAIKRWLKVSFEWTLCSRNQWTWPWNWRPAARRADRVARWPHCERNECHPFRWTTITRITIVFYWLVSSFVQRAMSLSSNASIYWSKMQLKQIDIVARRWRDYTCDLLEWIHCWEEHLAKATSFCITLYLYIYWLGEE